MAATPDAPRTEARRCRVCGGSALVRRQRTAQDRALAPAAGLRRYACRAAGCGWEGLLPRSGAARARAFGHRPAWATVAPWLLSTMLVAGLGAAIVYKLLGGQPAPDPALKHLVRAGESFDGNFLPRPHPLLKRVSERPPSDPADSPVAQEAAASAGMPASAPAGAPIVSSPVVPAPAHRPDPKAVASLPGTGQHAVAAARAKAPLHLRRHCAWGDPGRNPYRGTPEQALTLAQLPPEVVQQISADIQAQRVTDRVTITNATIRADASGREFNPQTVAMTYGHTLCVDTRVNFQRDHAERADLYEGTAADGRVYAVMVPAVCGNVSVLGQRGERFRPAAGAEQAAAEPMRRLPDALVFADDDPRIEKPGQRSSFDVPEPGTFWLVLPALVALALARRRR